MGTDFTQASTEGQKSVNHEVQFSGHLVLSVVLFKCDWFDPTPNRGTRVHPQYKLVHVNSKRSYPKFDPFVLTQQAQQVTSPFIQELKDQNLTGWQYAK
jgi:hypothetical protein